MLENENIESEFYTQKEKEMAGRKLIDALNSFADELHENYLKSKDNTKAFKITNVSDN